jgi:uncharacterized protein
MIETLREPWPWYVAGVLVGLTVPALLLIGNKSFGISSSLRHICAACVPADIKFFNYNWKREAWNLWFVGGILLGGVVAGQFLQNPQPVQISERTVQDLQALGVQDFSGLMPGDIFSLAQVFTLKGLIFFVVGGFLVGFGTRYAGGCTSGHAIMGLSNLQWPSLVATIAFMAGGFLMTFLGLPLIFSLF